MNLISSCPLDYKYVHVPLVILVGIVMIAFTNMSDIAGGFTIFANVLVIFVIYFAYIRRYWPLMDKVWDSGDKLIFMKGDKKIEVLYSQIARFKLREISGDDFDSPTTFFVKVHLNLNTQWGKSLRFMPATEVANSVRQPIEKIHEIEAKINRKN